MKIFLRGKLKLKFITNSPPIEDESYDDWLSEDFVVIGWLWHSLEPHVATSVKFYKTSRQI